MTEQEKLKTRIIIAKSIGISPDSIDVVSEKNIDLYFVDFKDIIVGVGYDAVPTIKEARDDIKDCYLVGCEWDFEEDMK